MSDAQWCYPEEGSYKMRLRQVRKQYSKWKKKAVVLQNWILKNFEEQKVMSSFTELMPQPTPDADIDDMFAKLLSPSDE